MVDQAKLVGASKDLARKIRELTRAGKLDWVVGDEENEVGGIQLHREYALNQRQHLAEVYDLASHFLEKLKVKPGVDFDSMDDTRFNEIFEGLVFFLMDLSRHPKWPMLVGHMAEDLGAEIKECSSMLSIDLLLDPRHIGASMSSMAKKKYSKEAVVKVFQGLWEVKGNVSPVESDPLDVWSITRCPFCLVAPS